MIIKKQDITSKALAKLVQFINSPESCPEDMDFGLGMITSLKSVNPGAERGLYSVDLEFRESYTGAKTRSATVTDPQCLINLYEILVSK